jgi:triacylglycerol lipase
MLYYTVRPDFSHLPLALKTRAMPYRPNLSAGSFTLGTLVVILTLATSVNAVASQGADTPVQKKIATQDTATKNTTHDTSVKSQPALKSAEDSSESAAGSRNSTSAKRVRVEQNQRFSEQKGKAGLCDVYLPASDPPHNGYPVVIVIHGGGWAAGDKWSIATYSRLLAQEGIVAVAINYRLAPTHKFPAQVDDVRSAMVWVHQNAQRLKLNSNQVGLFGYSAGGHLSALLASLADETMVVRAAASNWPVTDARWKQLPKICAVCAGGPPCDFRSLPIDNSTMAYFLGGSRREKPEAYIAASPAAHVSGDDPVTQLFHGEGDALVPLAGTQEFHKSQVKAGIDSRLTVIPKQGHMLTFISPATYQTVVNFFREVFFKIVIVSPR